MYARLRCGGNLPLCVRGLGTRNPSYGTELTLGVKKGFLWYATHFQKPSVLKIGFSGVLGTLANFRGIM